VSWTGLGTRFLESTRGWVVALLRRGAQTVEDLARALGLTDNAVRNHLLTLERDGIVRAEGVRRPPGAGKPATVYELHPDAEVLFSRAYAPALKTLIDVLSAELPPEQTEAILRRVGHSLAIGAGGAASGDLGTRVRAAAAVLTALGGEIDVLKNDGRYAIRGCSCPLAVAVADHPAVCLAVESLVANVTGEPTRSECEHGPRPRCCFAIQAAS